MKDRASRSGCTRRQKTWFLGKFESTLSPAPGRLRVDGGLVQFGSFASDNLGIQRTGCYTVLDMEEEAIITEVRPGTQRSLGEGLDINFLQVSFRLLRRTRYEDHGYKVTLKSPAWLSQLEPSAPLNGYLMERGEFSAELAKDERINEDLKVTVEVTDV